MRAVERLGPTKPSRLSVRRRLDGNKEGGWIGSVEPERRSAAVEFLMLEDRVLLAQCVVDHYRASGPGGQKRNKTSSATRLRHGPTGLTGSASDDRSQHVNKVRALRRLREAIALSVRTPIDLDNEGSWEMLRSCVGRDGRLQCGRRDARYYAVVSELLDLLAACGCSVGDGADRIGVSTANLVKFIQTDPKVWDGVNRMRRSANLKPLR